MRYRIRWSRRRQASFLRFVRRIKDARLRVRYMIVYHVLQGARPSDVAKAMGCARSTVYRVTARFLREEEAGLVDRREDNGAAKVDEHFQAELRRLLERSPPNFRWRRPSWTRELLIKQMRRETGIRVSLSTMSRALKALKARRGRPRPVVRCPWSKRRRARCLKAIRRLIAHLPAKEVVVWTDEVDIDLNPKIGWDWMLQGCQKEVVTPGQNEKRYLAGAMDARSGRLIWVGGKRKASALFVRLLSRLREEYQSAEVIHLILDNAKPHTSHYTQRTVVGFKGKIILHFLPPYSPDENRIERVWRDLHDNVTRNHRCKTIQALMEQVYYYLWKRNRRTAAAAKKRTLKKAKDAA